MKKLVLVMMVLGLALPVMALIIDDNDDLTVRGSTPYNASSPFGLFVKYPWNPDESYIEFTLGTTAASEALFSIYHYDVVTSDWTVGVSAFEADIDETTYTGIGTDKSGIELLGQIFVPQANPNQTFTVDVTSWYNANLGKTMTLNLWTIEAAGSMNSGPIFEDREGTGGSGEAGPQLLVTEVPEPATMALLGLGALVLRRKR